MQEITLGQIATFEMGQSPDSRYVSDAHGGIPFLQGNAEFGVVHPQPRLWCRQPKKTSQIGDCLISVRAPVGALNLADQAYCIGRGLAAVRFHGANPRYGAHLLAYFAPQLRRKAQGTTFEAVGKDDLATLVVNHFSDQEQARIAEVLDTLDEAIRGTEQVVTKLETMRPGILLQLVFPWLGNSGECPPDLMMASRSLLQRRGQLPASWEWMRLDSIAEVERGKFTYRPRNEPKLFGGRYPFIQTGDVVRALGGEIDTASQWLNDMGMRFSREFPAGTIAVTIAANIADTAILGIPMCFPDSVVGVVVRKPHSNRFVELCIRVAKLGLEARAPQSAQKNINLQDLRPLWIPTPPPEVQEQIAAAYEAHESKIRGEIVRLEKLRALKSGLTSDLLTGRVRVPDGASAC